MNLHVRGPEPGANAARATIVFIHGFPFDGSMWEPQLDALPDGWRGLAPDLRGFGLSPLDPDGDLGPATPADDTAGITRPGEPVITMARLADDVAALIRDRAAGRAVVCGLSMGGYVAFELLRRHPDLLDGLVLADTRAGADSDDARDNRTRMAQTVRDAGARPIAAAMIPDLLAPTTRATAPRLVETVRRMILDTPPTTLIAALAGMAARPDSTDDLPGITVPTLVAVGEHDAITPPDQARAMADAIPDARLVVIPDAGHLAGLENPDAFNNALAAYLEGLGR